MSLDEMIAAKIANKEYAFGSTDEPKNERDVIVDILTSSAYDDVTIYELNGLTLHASRSVREIAKKAIAERNGIALGEDGKLILDYPVTDCERAEMNAIAAYSLTWDVYLAQQPTGLPTFRVVRPTSRHGFPQEGGGWGIGKNQ